MSQPTLQIKLHGKNVKPTAESSETLFESSHFQQTQIIELNNTRGSFDEEISVNLAPEDLLEFEFEDGTIWLTPTEEVPALFPSSHRSSDPVLHIPAAMEIPTESRSIFKKIYLKFVKVFKPAEVVAEVSATLIAAKIESSILETEGLNHVAPNFKLSLLDLKKTKGGVNFKKPVLLLLHGTSSTTAGSFGEMENSETWRDVCTFYGDNILALEHRTWTKNPFENALDVIQDLPEGTQLHLLSHSRGGLVGEVLCRCSNEYSLFTEQEINMLTELERTEDVALLKELNKVAKKKNIVVEKFVRVACPAAGTTILSKRIDHFLNILLNVIGFGLGQKTNPLFIGIKSLLLAIVEQRTDPGVLPGLEVMVPESPLQKIINNHQIKIESDLCIIAGNAGIGGVKKTLLTIMTKLFYRLDNDFVVDTDSMYMGVVRENSIYYKFVDGSKVDHFCYFKNVITQQHIYVALTTPARESIPEFKEVRRGERNRNITSILPGGNVLPALVTGHRPIVVLLPGIMGSNLYDDETEIWIDYFKMASGDLARLHMNNEKVSAKSVVGTSYQKLVNSLEDQYDVVVFPYDWRKSLSVSGKRLADKIKKLQTHGQTISLIAHSMGGLVVRDLMMNQTTTWKKLNENSNFKCILLGTPWQGSYGIPEIITGIGKQIKSVSRLAIFQSRKELLKIFVRYNGLLQLLPIFEGSHDFNDLELWKTLQLVTDDSMWALPDPKDLTALAAYKKRFHEFENWQMDKVFYIAGKAEKTPSNFVCRDQQGGIFNSIDTQKMREGIETRVPFIQKNYELIFQSTSNGDGSVTWESGIPKQLKPHQVYYADTSHGELSNDPKRFDAIKDILSTGFTDELKHEPKVSRAIQQIGYIEPAEVLTNDVNILAKNILGLDTEPIFQAAAKADVPAVEITVKNGHLRYAKFPILTGHFKDDGIVSAEKVINKILHNKLSERQEIGLYPGNIGTSLVHLPDRHHQLGAVIIGLGSVEKLTPFLLTRSVELGCLEYLLTVGEYQGKTKEDTVGISTLLIGSRYSNLSLTNSINSILEGILNANKKIRKMNSDVPTISEIEFIELYKDRADNTFYQIHQVTQNNSYFHINLQHPLKRVQGARSFIPLDDEKEWWRRITAAVKTDPNTEKEYLGFSASTGRAMVEVRESFTNLHIIEALLDDNKKHTNWDRELTKTVFELLIPNDFKISFRNQQNILLILDKTTAAYPWELLNYDENLELPIVVSAGMIRQLATNDDRRILKPITNNKALIIGDPVLEKGAGIPQLPEAAAEANLVNTLLQSHNYETVPRINKSFRDIFKKLYDDYKIIHIASHGVIDYGEDKKTGILLSDNIVLTAAEINQISNTPELVFVNSCYMGEVNPTQEKHFRSKYKLAANIGVQFIENGVKAVVVAGWAVDDAAAKRFAEVFYNRMLNGEQFGEAVKEARSVCFREFPRTNTWGAYQCYGDQFYQLTQKRHKTGADQRYILDKEILIVLEEFMDKTRDPNSKKTNLLKQLEKISRQIDASGLRNGAITQLEIQAYIELEEYDIAMKKYDQLFMENDANFTVRALELWSTHRIKFLNSMGGNIGKEKFEAEIEAAIINLENLLIIGKTAERHNLLASIYKKKFLLVESTKNVLRNCAEQYKEGYKLKPNIYALTNWITTELLLNDGERMENIDIILDSKAEQYIKDQVKLLSETISDRKDFWDLLEPVNLQQTLLLFHIDDEDATIRKSIVEKIKTEYTNAWNLGGGTAQKKRSDLDQMQFIRESLVRLEKRTPKNKRRDLTGILSSLDELIQFFEDII